MKSELYNLYAYYRPSDTIVAVENLKILFDSVHNFFYASVLIIYSNVRIHRKKNNVVLCVYIVLSCVNLIRFVGHRRFFRLINRFCFH